MRGRVVESPSHVGKIFRPVSLELASVQGLDAFKSPASGDAVFPESKHIDSFYPLQAQISHCEASLNVLIVLSGQKSVCEFMFQRLICDPPLLERCFEIAVDIVHSSSIAISSQPALSRCAKLLPTYLMLLYGLHVGRRSYRLQMDKIETTSRRRCEYMSISYWLVHLPASFILRMTMPYHARGLHSMRRCSIRLSRMRLMT